MNISTFLIFLVLKGCHGTMSMNFTQSKYFLQTHHVELGLDSYNKEYLKSAWYKNSNYNRTYKSLDVSFDTLKAVTKKWRVEVDCYMFLSNEYRTFPPLHANANLCDAVSANVGGCKDILKRNGIEPKCPFPPGFYHAERIVIDLQRLPPFVPEGQYKSAFTVYDGNTKVGSGAWFGAVINTLSPKKGKK